MNSHEMKFLALGIFLVITLLFRILPALFRWIHTGIKGYNTSQLAQQKRTLGIKLLVLLGGVASLWVLIMGIAYGTKGISHSHRRRISHPRTLVNEAPCRANTLRTPIDLPTGLISIPRIHPPCRSRRTIHHTPRDL